MPCDPGLPGLPNGLGDCPTPSDTTLAIHGNPSIVVSDTISGVGISCTVLSIAGISEAAVSLTGISKRVPGLPSSSGTVEVRCVLPNSALFKWGLSSASTWLAGKGANISDFSPLVV